MEPGPHLLGIEFYMRHRIHCIKILKWSITYWKSLSLKAKNLNPTFRNHKRPFWTDMILQLVCIITHLIRDNNPGGQVLILEFWTYYSPLLMFLSLIILFGVALSTTSHLEIMKLLLRFTLLTSPSSRLLGSFQALKINKIFLFDGCCMLTSNFMEY